MNTQNLSLKSVIVYVIIFFVTFLMTVLSVYNYIQKKDHLVQMLHDSSNHKVERLTKTIVPFLTSYSVNEYEKLLEIEFKDKEVYAIVIEDYITGKLLGKPYITGKIRDNNWEIKDYESEQLNNVTNPHLHQSALITIDGKDIGKIDLYHTHYFLNKELDLLVINSIATIIIFALVLITLLFLGIKKFVLNPIEKIITTITKTDENGIPIRNLCEKNSYELTLLSQTINNMIAQVKQYQKLIIEQKEEFETIFNYAQVGIAITDLNGKFKKFNSAFETMLQYNQNELFKLNINDLYKSDTMNEEIEETISSGHADSFEKNLIGKDNKHITVHLSISLLPDKNHLLFIIKDITTLKLLEEQTKLASMGEMIGNIAHQWRQPLSVISTSVSGLKMRQEFGHEITAKEIAECSDMVVKQAQYLSDTINNFRNFLKGSDKDHTVISLPKVVENTVQLVEASIKNNYVTLIQNIDSNIKITGNVNELTEALINIINNSKDAFNTNKTSEEDRYIEIKIKANQNKAELTICDSAGGIPEEFIDRIFEPYFTTKHQSVGTGLGLPMVNKIVCDRHHGSINVYNDIWVHENKQLKGVCFKLSFERIG